jgi:pyruvate dehydrogenase E2 component (dihydrolipoamide acetyltransferase)
MIYEFRLPDVGEGIAEGEIVKWFVQKKETIEEDQPVAEIQTDKALIEITSPVSGSVKEVFFQEGDIAKVGSVIISFETRESEGFEVKQKKVEKVDKQHKEKEKPLDNEFSSHTSSVRKRAKAAPTVRRLARELQIDLLSIKGSGKNGRILEEDVRSFVKSQKRPKQSKSEIEVSTDTIKLKKSTSLSSQFKGIKEERIGLRGLRRSIANKMTISTTVAAQSTILEEINVSHLVTLRKQLAKNAKEKGVHLTYLPFVIKAIIPALKEFPYLNSSLDDSTEEILLKYNYNIGIATDTTNGLMVPVIKDADHKSLLHLACEISELAEKSRTQKVTMKDISGGTFTITNIGATGVGIFGTPVINHPEAAILGIHKIQKKPIVVNESQIEIHDMLGLSLSFDHRIVDGAMASYFLKKVIKSLENPNLLFLDMI